MNVDGDRVAAALPAYDVAGELGRGAFGVVLAGRHRRLGREVAIKQLPGDFADDAEVRARFVAEAQLLASFDHPHVVAVYDFVEHDGLCLLIMERLTGGTVWQRYCAARFDPPTCCSVVVATCAGLHYAHQRGALHRDVKPDNLMFSPENRLKVTDFGIAKVLGGAGSVLTRAGEVLGTPAYIAPEQATDAPLSPATDVYAAGTVLYELLAGQLPFPSVESAIALLYKHVHEEPRSLALAAPSMPEPITEVVMRAIARDPGDRYPSAEEFGAAIARAGVDAWGPSWMAGTGVPVAAPARVRTDGRRRPLTATGPAPVNGGSPAPAAPGPGRAAPRPLPPAAAGRPSLGVRRPRVLAGAVGAVLATGAALWLIVVPNRTQPELETFFQDDFSQVASGWSQKDDEGGSLAYAGGRYRIAVKKPQWIEKSDTELEGAAFRRQLVELEVVSAEVDVSRASDGPGVFGLICRESADHNTFYAGLIDGNGFWGLFRYEAGKAKTISKGETASLGGQASRLRLDCLGSGPATTLRLHVDGDQVAQARDPDGLAAGLAGLMAAATDRPGIDVQFDNFVMRREKR